MNKYDLSILIPARNEMFLAKTIEDILEHMEGHTEVIAVLDGAWADPGIKQHKHVTVVYLNQSIGQRAATNLACKLSNAKYVMKVDAHCKFDQGFDKKLLADIAGHDDWTIAPAMRNLWAFDWVCPDGHRRYQSPSGPCRDCGKETHREIMWSIEAEKGSTARGQWKGRKSPKSTSYCFDSEPHFQYFKDFSKRPEGQGDITESMSLQGSCFMMTRQKYWELNICDESFGSWGSQGIEVAVKTWLSGGKVMISHRTWYAHLFRTQGSDFGFPYELSQAQIDSAKKKAKELFFNNKWDKAIYPLSWLVDKFWPVFGWTEEDRTSLKKAESGLTKGIIYYSDNRLDPKIMKVCSDQLEKSGLPVFKSILAKGEPGPLTMFKQILFALENMETDIVFFAEHDVLYHPSHFKFTPDDKDTFYYNVNVWKVRHSDGFAVKVDNCRQTSGICVYRETAIRHYKERIALVEKEGYSRKMGFEPGTHERIKWEFPVKSAAYTSEFPNLDIRHDTNLTPNRWSPDQFRDKKNCQGWTESNIKDIDGWQG